MEDFLNFRKCGRPAGLPRAGHTKAAGEQGVKAARREQPSDAARTMVGRSAQANCERTTARTQPG